MPELTIQDHMPIQYCDPRGYVTAELADATSAAVFTPDSEVLIVLERTRRGLWRAQSGDHWTLTYREARKRWATADAAVAELAAGRGLALNEITFG